jgi:hypothetical protein
MTVTECYVPHPITPLKKGCSESELGPEAALRLDF